MPESYITSLAVFWGILVIWIESKTALSKSAKVRRVGHVSVVCYFLWGALFCVLEFVEDGLTVWSAVGEFIAPIFTMLIFLILWLWWSAVKSLFSEITRLIKEIVRLLS